MKELTLVLGLTLPILLDLDIELCNITIAVIVWIYEVIKWYRTELL